MRTPSKFALIVTVASVLATPIALACQIENTTDVNFTVASGNVSNQRVGAHTTTSIDDGNISLVGDNGAGGGGGFCAYGQHVQIVRSGSGFAVVPAP